MRATTAFNKMLAIPGANVAGVQFVWVPESRAWVLSCGFVGEAIRPR
jgi:hypothetical protein